MNLPRVFSARPLVVTAFRLPPSTPGLGMAWLEGHVATNARVFAEAGVPYVKLRDQTRDAGRMTPDAPATAAAPAILLGGGVTTADVREVLAAADGVIVSTSSMRRGASSGDVPRWGIELTRRFTDDAYGV